MEQRNQPEKHQDHNARLEAAARQYLSKFTQLEAARDYLSKCVPAPQYLSKFIPVGYRFNPTDEELILHYLLPMINGSELPINVMHIVNIYKFKPDCLTANYAAQSDNVWYFFTSRDRKYRNGFRPDRKAGNGYWKATGADKDINHEGKKIGSRKALVFYEGKPPKGRKTPWIMHEFRVPDSSTQSNKKRKREHHSEEDTCMRLDDFVLCRIYKKEGIGRTATRLQKHGRVDNIEQEDKKVVEENGQNAVEAAFEQQDQQVEIGETSSHNNINVEINALQMDQGCFEAMKYGLPLTYGIVESQMLNNSHTSFMGDQDLDLSNLLTPTDYPVNLSSIFQ